MVGTTARKPALADPRANVEPSKEEGDGTVVLLVERGVCETHGMGEALVEAEGWRLRSCGLATA